MWAASEAELDLLRNRVGELLEQQEESKCILKEQAEQLELYREKYLAAEQTIEELNVTIEKLKTRSTTVDMDIGNEIKEIHDELQRRLNEFQQYPSLLDIEKRRIAQLRQERDELELELEVANQELAELKSKDTENEAEYYRAQWVELTLELQQTQAALKELQQERDRLFEELPSVKDHLNTLRSKLEETKSSTETRADQLSHSQQKRIDKLENELSKHRTMASRSPNRQDHILRELQGELNSLSHSLAAAQEQIKTLNSRFLLLNRSKEDFSSDK